MYPNDFANSAHWSLIKFSWMDFCTEAALVLRLLMAGMDTRNDHSDQ